jgi:membrane-associated phospholipid phosphatase
VLLVSLALLVRFGGRPSVDTTVAEPATNQVVLWLSGLASSIGGYHVRTAILAVALASLLGAGMVREATYVVVVVEAVHIVDRSVKVWVGSSRPSVNEGDYFVHSSLRIALILCGLGLIVGWWLLRGRRTRVMWLLVLLPLLYLVGEIPRSISVPAGGGSFPSGHAANSMALSVAIVIGSHRGRSSAWLAAAALVVVVIGASRITLGYHYPIDVFGGWLLGIAAALGIGALMLGGPAPLGLRTGERTDDLEAPKP